MSELDQGGEYPPWWHHPRTPLADVAGRPADDVAQLDRGEGFVVETRNLDGDTRVTTDLSDNRIRLWTRNGLVDHASQG